MIAPIFIGNIIIILKHNDNTKSKPCSFYHMSKDSFALESNKHIFKLFYLC